MIDEERSKYMNAGRIARDARNFGAGLIKEGKSYLEVAEQIEKFITEKGAKPAFPVNLATNNQAAHYSPGINDKRKFRSGDIVKVDVGVHIDGYIADTAVTVEVGNEQKYAALIDAAHLALENAIAMIENNMPVRRIGTKVEETIRLLGFKPVSNLTGHEIRRYNLHAGKSVPNISDSNPDILYAGDVVAIEPFVSTGTGYVDSSGRGGILRVMRERPLEQELNAFYVWLKENFGYLPFSPRWCLEFGADAEKKIHTLLRYGVLYEYSILSDTGGGIVTQAEHTVIVTEKGCEVTTK